LEVVQIHEYCINESGLGKTRRVQEKKIQDFKIERNDCVCWLGGVPTSLAGRDLAFAGLLPRPAKGIGMLLRCLSHLVEICQVHFEVSQRISFYLRCISSPSVGALHSSTLDKLILIQVGANTLDSSLSNRLIILGIVRQMETSMKSSFSYGAEI